MAALVPLLTVAALAIAGWLASGVVTVRSLAAPGRIGLLSLPQTLLAFLVPLLALEWIVRRTHATAPGDEVDHDRRTSPAPTRSGLASPRHGDTQEVGAENVETARAVDIAHSTHLRPWLRRGRPLREVPAGHRWNAGTSRLRAVVVLLIPIVLPWLPLPLPAALLVWTGPLALAWWLVVVAYAYADAFRLLALPVVRLAQSPRHAPIVSALLTGALLLAAAWRMAPQHPKGDEPDYLIITQSLLLDRDLQIENNHTRADYAIYHSGPLPPSYLARGTNGAIYSVHAPGLPVLLAPGFALAGYGGTVATLVLIAMAGTWLAWWTAWRVTSDVAASWVGTLATVGSAPLFLHGAAIFPDAPASVLALGAVAVLLGRARPSTPAQVAPAFTSPHASTHGEQAPLSAICAASLALGLLPWMHTRYAILSVGLGAAICLQIALRRDWRALAIFVAPAALLALAWFGFFFAVYGTPNPSAPYGAYTQMAIAHLLPGLPGLLFDQQFGLLASAPVLMAALLAMRPAVREAAPGTWWTALFVAVLALLYTCVVGAYRMWWGGLSAPARFLVPLILPMAPFIAIGWQSLRTRASRHVVIALLVASLALTALLVCVDHGVLAYNMRDGRARWALWLSPLVDLSGALPAAHRDAPAVVMRDALIWLAGLATVWAGWRAAERHGRLTPSIALVTVAVLVPAVSALVWLAHATNGLSPANSQVRYLARRASAPADVLVAISRPDVGPTRAWFDIELDSRRARTAADYSVLRLDTLPAGRYRLLTDVRASGARFGVTLGESRAARFIADLDTSVSQASSPFELALPVENLVVKGSREAAEAAGRTWLVADEVSAMAAIPPATQVLPIGDGVWLLPEAGIYAEPGGAWLGGDADVIVGLASSRPVDVQVRAGAAAVVVTWSGAGEGEATLSAGQSRTMTMVPRQGRLRLRTRGGFRPSQVSPGETDQRYLGAWISAPPH